MFSRLRFAQLERSGPSLRRFDSAIGISASRFDAPSAQSLSTSPKATGAKAATASHASAPLRVRTAKCEHHSGLPWPGATSPHPISKRVSGSSIAWLQCFTGSAPSDSRRTAPGPSTGPGVASGSALVDEGVEDLGDAVEEGFGGCDFGGMKVAPGDGDAEGSAGFAVGAGSGGETRGAMAAVAAVAPGRPGDCSPGLPQIRTCGFPASGSSVRRFARGDAVGSFRVRQRKALE